MKPEPHDYDRFSAAIRGEPLPLALVDLDALDRNVDTLLAPVRAHGKTARIASKSVRSVELLRRIAQRGGAAVRGIMAYSPFEAHWLAGQGFDDILIAYPTAQPAAARLVAQANAAGAAVSLMVDDPTHLEVAAAAAAEVGARIPIIIDIDVAYRPLGGRLHLGVRRSPLRDADAVVALVERAAASSQLVFAGLMAYEAHIAGVGDASPFEPHLNAPKRALKRLAGAAVLQHRRAVTEALARRGIAVPLFNGGGTGSVAGSSADPTLSEVTIGSGFLDSHLFDYYRGLTLAPAAFFALEITRRPAAGFVTCHGGGFVASGAIGADRLPIPYLPAGLALTSLEGAGEVQTPLVVPPGLDLAIGAPVFFRHAKAGELAEHFREYLLVRGDRVEGRAPTYRGAGQCFG